jgi:octaprenyl-diphosphate synthase
MVAALRGGQTLGLPASKQRMHELGISTGVVRAIDEELAAAGTALAPFAKLAPVPLMLQLGEMLRKQVAALSVPAGAP